MGQRAQHHLAVHKVLWATQADKSHFGCFWILHSDRSPGTDSSDYMILRAVHMLRCIIADHTGPVHSCGHNNAWKSNGGWLQRPSASDLWRAIRKGIFSKNSSPKQ